ncbi:MAG: NAD(P)-dependent oxidoreductase [Snowella sp.]|jgi:nucleoside-diphosphate-sugar epimerase|nr:MAG: NAD(P)-dependent oxidoreductase [Snowella sp.]
MTKILITGTSGFIGNHLLHFLIKQDLNVLGIDIVPPQDNQYLPFFKQTDLLELGNLITTVQQFQPDFIFHLAARTDLNETKDIRGYASNIDGVENLIAAIRQTPSVKRCIFTSSQLVCKVGYVPKDENEYNPNNLYGESKVLTEKIVRENDGGGVEWCIVRPTTVWGPGMSSHYQRFLKMVNQGRYFHIGNSSLYKSYSYIGNIVYQYKMLMESPSELINKKTFYLADYSPISLHHWIDLIQEEMGAKPVPTYPEGLMRFLAIFGDILSTIGVKKFPFNTFRLNNILTEYTFDLSETEKICGELPFSIEEGVKELVIWLKNEKIIT